MAGRIRTIKPEWIENQRLSACSDAARVLSVGLIILSDDYGRGRASIGYLAGQVWPESEDARKRVKKTLPELVDIGYVKLYTVSSQDYFELPGWPRHQVVKNPGKPRVPDPTEETLPRVYGDSTQTRTPDHDHDHDHVPPIVDFSADGSDSGSGPEVSQQPKPKPKARAGTVSEATQRFIEAFNGVLKRRVQVKGWEESVRKVLSKGHTEADLRAVAWWAGTEWADDDDMRKRLSPKTLLKFQSSQGYRTFPEYLALAGERWRELHDDEIPPWERLTNGVNEEARA